MALEASCCMAYSRWSFALRVLFSLSHVLGSYDAHPDVQTDAVLQGKLTLGHIPSPLLRGCVTAVTVSAIVIVIGRGTATGIEIASET